MGTYDFLWKVPVVDIPSFDGTRDTDAAFQREIDRLVDDLLARHRVPCRRLDPAVDRDSWIHEISRVLLPDAIQKSLF